MKNKVNLSVMLPEINKGENYESSSIIRAIFTSYFFHHKTSKYISIIVIEIDDNDTPAYNIYLNALKTYINFKKLKIKKSKQGLSSIISRQQIKTEYYSKINFDLLIIDCCKKENKIIDKERKYIEIAQKITQAKNLLIILNNGESNTLLSTIKETTSIDFQFSIISLSSRCSSMLSPSFIGSNSISILNIRKNKECYSYLLKKIYEKELIPNNDMLIITANHLYEEIIFNKKVHKFNYNPSSKILYVRELKGDNGFINEQIINILKSLEKNTKLYFSYGNTEKSSPFLQYLKKQISLFFPFINSKHDRMIEHFNKPIKEITNELANSDLLVLLVNKKYLQSKYCLKELLEIYKKKNNSFESIIFVIDQEVRDILNDHSSTEEHIYQYWHNKKTSLEQEKLETKYSISDRDKEIEQYHTPIIEGMGKIVNEIKERYGNKSFDEHVESKCAEILYTIYQYLRDKINVDLYALHNEKQSNIDSGKCFEAIINKYSSN